MTEREDENLKARLKMPGAFKRRKTRIILAVIIAFIVASAFFALRDRRSVPITRFLWNSFFADKYAQVGDYKLMSAEVRNTAVAELAGTGCGKYKGDEGLAEWFGEREKETNELDFALVRFSDGSGVVAQARFSRTDFKIEEVFAERKLSEGLFTGLWNVQSFFDGAQNTPYEKVNCKRVEKAFHDPRSIENLWLAIDYDVAHPQTETGGLITLVDENDPYLKVYLVPASGADFISKVDAARGKYERAARLVRENPDQFVDLPVRRRATLFALDNPKLNRRQRAKSLDQFIDLYLFTMRYTYLPDLAAEILLLAEGIDGYFVGDFHVHPPDNEPSYEDKAASKLGRVLVLVPRASGFDLYDMHRVAVDALPPTPYRHRESTK